LPHNLLIIDVPVYESCLFKAGLRGAMLDAKAGLPRQPGSVLSLRSILHSLHVPIDFALHNSGNDAFACLLVLQMLVDPKNTQAPPPRLKPAGMALASTTPGSLPLLSPAMVVATMPRSQSASHILHLDTGESPMIPRSSPFPKRFSTGDMYASAGAPDEEGRIKDVPDSLNSKLTSTTIG
jgi:hypothetical protein